MAEGGDKSEPTSKGPVKGILKKGGGKTKKGVGISVPQDGCVLMQFSHPIITEW